MRLAVALLLALSTTLAFAGPDVAVAPANTTAAQLFTEGRELKAAGKVAEACQRFENSWRAEHAAGTEVNLADCREREGKLLEAWQLFDEAARVSEQQGNRWRAEFARNRANAIDARLMTVEVRLGAPVAKDIAVTIDGRPTLRHRIDPKPVWVRATAPGGKTYAVFVAAQRGKVIVDVPSLVLTTTHRRRSRLYIAGGMFVVGVASFMISDRLFNIAGEVREQGRLELATQNETAATVLLAGGVASVVGAAVVWYTAPKERVLVTPTATTNSVGVSLVGRF